MAWGEMPDLCMRSPYVYEQLMEHARTLICDLGYDGFRFDFVKGYGSWMIKAIQEREYLRGAAIIKPFGVAEAWASDREIDDWLDEANRWSDNPIGAFDFPLRYRLKDLCDSYGYSLKNLLEPGTLFRDKPFQAVTFVENHDFRGGGSDPIFSDKLLAYAFILTHPGYPCVFWHDYFELGLAQPDQPTGIDALVAAHESFAGGELIVRYLTDDLYIMERAGTASQPGLIFVLNNRGDGWQGAWIDTCRSSTRYAPVAWWGHDQTSPMESWTAADGRGQFWAAPRGYAVYAPMRG
jgi:alpha-amylase